MDSEEITKLVDGVYKNILELFNPNARQLISAGKSYLKSLHGAASAARVFYEALAKIGVNAQHNGTDDIGTALLSIVGVYKEIQEQQMNVLKAFYVDLLVPLETNLEKDTRVVQYEQKKFLQQHKICMENYQKAMSTMKKQRKKKSSPENTEKKLRTLEFLEEQKKRLDTFCELSYKNAMLQERRRYGFILERQCSIAKHWIIYHNISKAIIDNQFENWQSVAALREIIPSIANPTSIIQMSNKRSDDELTQNGSHNGHSSDTNQPVSSSKTNKLKKSRSIDAPYGDIRTMHHHDDSNESFAQNSLPRAKSDFHLNKTATSITPILAGEDYNDNCHWDQRVVVKALFTYMPSGENQLMLDEGDRIALMGSRAKGWQFGENLRTQTFGWFPIAYTNTDLNNNNKSIRSECNRELNNNYPFEQSAYKHNKDTNIGPDSYPKHYIDGDDEEHLNNDDMDSEATFRRDRAEETSPTRMFGDTYRPQKKYRSSTVSNNPRPGPPPTLPAPVPDSQNSTQLLYNSQSICKSRNSNLAIERRTQKLQNVKNEMVKKTGPGRGSAGTSATATKISLYSSNDSGFANEPPPQPEVDYTDDEQQSNGHMPIRRKPINSTNTLMKTSRGGVALWTLSRNFRCYTDNNNHDNNRNFELLNRNSNISSNDKSKRYDLITSDDELLQTSVSSGVKRTKSFWRFGGGRNDDILTGMSLWQHRDLIATPQLIEEPRDELYDASGGNHKQNNERDDVNKRNTSINSKIDNHSISSQGKQPQHDNSIINVDFYDDENDENIYGIVPSVRDSKMSSTSCISGFTPNEMKKSRMKIMKTIEIDIENPTDNRIKRPSSSKRIHNEYRDNVLSQQQEQHHHQQRQQYPQNNHHRQQQYQSQSNNRSNSFSDNKKSQHIKSNQYVGAPNKHMLQNLGSPTLHGRSNPEEILNPSTESDVAESELENGTLKMSDMNNFFDSNGMMAGGITMKTVKRKDILKQYYTSEDESDDPEIKSTSSDPYDCIVINDHLVKRDNKQGRGALHMQEHQIEFQTFRAASSKPITMTNTTTSQNGKKNKIGLYENNREQNKNHTYSKTNYQSSEKQHYGTRSHQTRQSQDSSMSLSQTPTATILPRTRLMRSSIGPTTMSIDRAANNDHQVNNKYSVATNSTGSHNIHINNQTSNNNNNANIHGNTDHNGHYSHDIAKHYDKQSYGPWYDFWNQQKPIINPKKQSN